MIRLGSMAGYPFEGPRVLAGWNPPPRAAVYAVLVRPEPERRAQEYAVIDVDHAEDLSLIGFPFRHPRAACWLERAANRYQIHLCWYEVPGGLPSHREQIVRELVAVYKPGCSPRQYDASWKREWIGDYTAPTTGPLTTDHSPRT